MMGCSYVVALPIFSEYFIITLRMSAGRACLWGFRPFVHVSAVYATPHHGLVLFEYTPALDVGCETGVALLMLFFGNSDVFVNHGNNVQPFLTCYFSESWVHLSPFMLFTGSSRFEIVESGSYYTRGERCANGDFTTFEKSEEALGMFLLLICRLFSQALLSSAIQNQVPAVFSV